jgi:hypothetical protein
MYNTFYNIDLYVLLVDTNFETINPKISFYFELDDKNLMNDYQCFTNED